MKRKASTESKSAPLEWHEKRSPVEVIPFEDWTRSDIVPELDELHSKILKEVQPDLKYYDYRGKPLPRQKAFYGDKLGLTYFYTGGHLTVEKLTPPTIAYIKKFVESYTRFRFNTVVVTYYKDGDEWISPHHDKTVDWVQGSSVVSVSFGAERTLQIERSDKRRSWQMKLPHGSLYHIRWDTNKNFTHSIVKEEASSARLSLTFRNIETVKVGKKFVSKTTGLDNPVSRTTLLKKYQDRSDFPLEPEKNSVDLPPKGPVDPKLCYCSKTLTCYHCRWAPKAEQKKSSVVIHGLRLKPVPSDEDKVTDPSKVHVMITTRSTQYPASDTDRIWAIHDSRMRKINQAFGWNEIGANGGHGHYWSHADAVHDLSGVTELKPYMKGYYLDYDEEDDDDDEDRSVATTWIAFLNSEKDDDDDAK